MSFDHYIVDSDENSNFMYNFIKKILEDVGPRPSCSQNEKKAAHIIAEDLKEYCDEVEIEEFETHPRAFLGWFRIVVPSMLISLLILSTKNLITNIGATAISIFFVAFGIWVIYKNFLCYETWTTKIIPYKKGISQNVIGILKPSSGEIKKRVVFGAHYDSAFRFNLIEWPRQAYVYYIGSGILGIGVSLTIGITNLVYLVGGIPHNNPFTYILNWIVFIIPFFIVFFLFVMGKSEQIFYGAFQKFHRNALYFLYPSLAYSIISVLLLFNYLMVEPLISKTAFVFAISSLPYLIGLFLYLGKKAVPGAIDNLTGCAPVLCAAKILSDWKKKKLELFPKYTEVVFVFFGSEEVGLKGSQYFAEKRANEYNKIDTTCINLESLQESRYQRIYKRENTTNTDLSPEVYLLLAQCSEELGIDTHLRGMPGIAGGTDAAGLVRGGLKATSIEGINYKDYLNWYHTSRDNLDIINKVRKDAFDIGTNYKERNIRAAMENALKTMLFYLKKKDEEVIKEKIYKIH
ncbi:MAG: M20/M25/M40 family metallo-hydrolase [Promethearchaeota archaeon]